MRGCCCSAALSNSWLFSSTFGRRLCTPVAPVLSWCRIDVFWAAGTEMWCTVAKVQLCKRKSPNKLALWCCKDVNLDKKLLPLLPTALFNWLSHLIVSADNSFPLTTKRGCCLGGSPSRIVLCCLPFNIDTKQVPCLWRIRDQWQEWHGFDLQKRYRKCSNISQWGISRWIVVQFVQQTLLLSKLE